MVSLLYWAVLERFWLHVILEYLGVNTSKTISLIETGEELQRNDEPSPTRSAVMVRLSHSHIRFGTFQRQAFLNETDNLESLTQYCISKPLWRP